MESGQEDLQGGKSPTYLQDREASKGENPNTSLALFVVIGMYFSFPPVVPDLHQPVSHVHLKSKP